MIILSIETSCDDTCAALVKATGRKRPRFEILSDIKSSQVKIHAPYGGVVPTLAARAHLENMNHVLKLCFKNVKCPAKGPLRPRSEASETRQRRQMSNVKCRPDLIAVTTHPGLIPCLLIGTNVARTLAWIWNKPIIGVNHLEGHLYAPIANSKLLIANRNKKNNEQRAISNKQQIVFPAICLIVSGGHTQLVLMRDYGKFKIIGETLDDAAGEAFDKVARLLGLPFPGGPAIAAKAAKFKMKNEKLKINLPRPMINSGDYDFSFSGLKTAVLYLAKDKFTKNERLSISKKRLTELCAEFQQAVIDVLIAKTIKAAKNYKAQTIILGGGVGANKELRNQLEKAIKENLSRVNCQLSPVKYCTDNAVMIAIAGYYRYLKRKAKTWKEIKARAIL